MSTCQIMILLDESQPHMAGEPISGTVVVSCEKETTCSALVVRCLWKTHGRGNVETGDVDQKTLFEGTWQAGQKLSYPFRLDTARWPPTYYGTYVNVSHYIVAQAQIPWTRDPKEQVEFPLIATTAPADLKPTVAKSATSNSSWLWWIVGPVILSIVLAGFATIMLVFLPLIAIIGGGIWFFREVLPRRITGPVTCELADLYVVGGDTLRGTLSFTPQRASVIDGIVWTVKCEEECSSGSGSDRKTYRHVKLSETVRVSERRQLAPGVAQSSEFQFTLPTQVAPSLKFSDNHIKWNVEARIEIPRWPDWTKVFELVVSPQAASAETGLDGTGTSAVESPMLVAFDEPKTPSDGDWFEQVLGQLRKVAHESEPLAQVLAAVRDFEFPLKARLENAIDTPEFDDERQFAQWNQAQWWAAYSQQANQSVALAWLRAPRAIQPGAEWSGWAAIVGYDVDAQRVLMVATR